MLLADFDKFVARVAIWLQVIYKRYIHASVDMNRQQEPSARDPADLIKELP